MKRFCLLATMILCLGYQLSAQRSFSEDKAEFYRQVMSKLNSFGTESARKVAYDFNAAWNSKFTSEHQDLIHKIALRMDRKGIPFDPAFRHYFSYLAFADAQAHLTRDQVTQVLKINEQVLETMTGEEYGKYLLSMNIFMARRYLTLTKNLIIRTDNGTYSFNLLDDYVQIEEEEPLQQYLEQNFEPEPEPEVIVQETETLAADDGWSNDDWGNDDDWGDDWGNDDWGSNDDNWVDDQDTWGYDVSGEVIEQEPEVEQRNFVSAIAQDYVANLRAKYRHPLLEGPVIDLQNNSMLIATKYDSFNIKETDGKFLLKTRVYAGENAVINWPQQNKSFPGAVVNLKQFYIRADHYGFWTPYATLTSPSLFNGQVEGYFEFKSVRRRPGTLSQYPIFRSNEANVELTLPGNRVKYKGGVELRGNDLYGAAVSRHKGTLTVLDGKGTRAVFRAVEFEFRVDSMIYADNASVSIINGNDSTYHPSVEMYYDGSKGKLTAIRTKKYNVTPFYSTYFKFNINAQGFTWRLDDGEIDFNIMQGKDLIAVTFESKDYFNYARFSKLAVGHNFHPVITSVFYANKFGTRDFVDQEIADYFKVDIKQVKSGMRTLEQYGFASYNHETGLVKLKDKAYLYHDASGEKVDYDNIMIPSIEPEKPNATWRLDSSDIMVNGVERFYYTSDFKVYAEPDSGVIFLKQDRNIFMDGMVHAGEFEYKGKSYEFDYEGFLINMPVIDSIRISLKTPDSLIAEGASKQTALPNHLNGTSGTLYLNYPDNKSGKRSSSQYPDFVSESEAIVYFDGVEVLNGAYDKSVKFIIPPFDSDSLDSEATISFDGTFNSGGIFPTFQETLSLQPDQSLGFIHQIPPSGYNLYGTEARTYEKIRLSNQGMRGGGKIDFITSTIYSDDFVYYPDSVAAYGRGGTIKPGEINGASYPEAVLGPYRMHWEPRIDSMHLQNLRSPFKFYNATATLDGAVNITSRGVYGIGTMLTRGSKSISKDLNFKQYSYSARHADFEVLTDNPNKPAMAGDDISLNFDLTTNTAVVQPEKQGVAAISFPYAQMKTSITRAVWDLEDSTVTMTKPDNVPLRNSYFYTTRKELDSLAFNARQATYDLNTKELEITGIPYIIVADAKIIPKGNKTTILENSELQQFQNAEVIIDTLNEYHYLYDGDIKILSRNAFIGTAKYQLVTGIDTFAIKFDRFVLEDVFVDEKPVIMTVSGGQVLAKENLKIAPGFYYKGETKMYANKKSLDLNGSVKLILQDPSYDSWVLYERTDGNPFVSIDFTNAYFDNEEKAVAGLFYDLRGGLYSSFVRPKKSGTDEAFFIAKGQLEYDTASLTYRIEKPSKTLGESYDGHTLIYDDNSKNLIFEGPVSFFGQFAKDVTVMSSVMGTGNVESNEYELDAFLGFEFKNSGDYMKIMAQDLTDIVERLGPPLANDISLPLLYKLANLTSDKLAREYETGSLKDYRPLLEVADNLVKSLVVSGVKMKWSQSNQAWYNTTKLAISNIYGTDINAKLDGFIEIKKDLSNNDILNIFITPAPGTWYFISYSNNNLMMYSSNSAFNDEITAESNYGKAKADELVLVLGDDTETLTFINNFRETYFGITEPYDLISPQDVNLEDENFETIQEDKDDGFGF
ncbi:hypothetical protein [Marinoscillum pacificum]|uniref:hypothetical protein n=1 Tax=Marinoscillum pacificum TaxID=392723 RepID=UPI002157457F|nr:hypothetical protein [Marinoscillum pacificum]